ncbi:hypothetical protein Taro_004620, partial [Colocasia esculenta]|nr:hypothetical protein [Colocasia esculenta]
LLPHPSEASRRWHSCCVKEAWRPSYCARLLDPAEAVLARAAGAGACKRWRRAAVYERRPCALAMEAEVAVQGLGGQRPGEPDAGAGGGELELEGARARQQLCRSGAVRAQQAVGQGKETDLGRFDLWLGSILFFFVFIQMASELDYTVLAAYWVNYNISCCQPMSLAAQDVARQSPHSKLHSQHSHARGNWRV